VGRLLRVILRIHGQRLGWLRLHHELAAIARIRTHLHGTVQPETLCELHDVVRFGDVGEHASAICWIPAGQEQRSYGCAGYVVFLLRPFLELMYHF